MHRALLAAALAAPLALAAAALPSPAAANEAEVRDVARNSNCSPGRIEVLRRSAGAAGSTVYRVACAGGGAQAASIRVECKGRTCTLLN